MANRRSLHHELKLGGMADAAAMSALGAAALMTNPAIAGNPLAIAGLAGAGGAWLGHRVIKSVLTGHSLDSAIKVSSHIPGAIGGTDKALLGYTTDTGLPLMIPDVENYAHRFIIGQSGVGKTTLLNLLMFQQMQRGGGIFAMNGKLDDEDLQMFYRMARWCGREKDILVLNPGNPAVSNTYNPILYGDPDEVSARILSLIPSTESSAGADYYKQSANQGIATLVAALKAAKYAYNFMDLTILLLSPKALEFLNLMVRQRANKSQELLNLELFISQFRTQSRIGTMEIDMKKLKDVFGGMGSRMFMFATNQFGQVMNDYAPELRLEDALRQKKLVYVMLPTLGKDIAANNLGKLVVADYRTALSWIQALPKSSRPVPYTLASFDEAGSYITETFNRIFEQVRTAHQMLTIGVQTVANLEAISEELREMVLGNTWLKIIFKIGTPESAEKMAQIIGEQKNVMWSLGETGSSGRSGATTDGMPDSSATQGVNVGRTGRQEIGWRVDPTKLAALDRGEALVLRGGKNLYSLRIPQIEFTKEFIEESGKFEINRFRMPRAGGIDLYSHINDFLDSETRSALENESRSKSGKKSETGA